MKYRIRFGVGNEMVSSRFLMVSDDLKLVS